MLPPAVWRLCCWCRRRCCCCCCRRPSSSDPSAACPCLYLGAACRLSLLQAAAGLQLCCRRHLPERHARMHAHTHIRTHTCLATNESATYRVDTTAAAARTSRTAGHTYFVNTPAAVPVRTRTCCTVAAGVGHKGRCCCCRRSQLAATARATRTPLLAAALASFGPATRSPLAVAAWVGGWPFSRLFRGGQLYCH